MPDSFTSNDPYTKARLVAMGALPAQPDMQTMTLANSINTPYSQAKYDSLAQASDQGVSPSNYAAAEAYKQSRIVKGAVTGQTPTNNMIAPTDTVFQAYTGGGAPAQTAKNIYTNALEQGSKTYNAFTEQNAAGGVVKGASQNVSGGSGLDAAYNDMEAYLKSLQARKSDDEIRAQTMQRFQNEIDALNSYYAEKKRQMLAIEAPKAESRLGSNAAISARRGMIGSDFGATQTQNVMDLNAERQNQIISSVDAEKNAAIEAKRAEANGASEAEINRLRNAQAQGLTANIDLQEKMAKYQDDKVTKAVNSLAMSGQTVSDADLEKRAASLGIDVDELKSRVEFAKKKPDEKPIEVDGALVSPSTGKVIYQSPSKKRVTVNGVVYEIQSDGTYKAVTPEEVKADDYVHVSATRYQKAGFFNKKTGEFFPEGTLPSSVKPSSTGSAPIPSNKKIVPPSSNKKYIPSESTAGKKDSVALSIVQRRIASGVMRNENGNAIRVGGDGKLSPQDYLTLRNAWITDGRSPTVFDTKMKGYRNPDNDAYAVGK